VVSLTEVKKAGRRLCVAAVLLAAASSVYYFSDEVSFAYREVDGYLPVLWIVRLGALIVAMGLLFAIAYPVRVLAVRGPLALRDRQRSGGASGRPRGMLRLERVLDVVLCLAALGCTYLLVKPALIEALLPLSGVGWVSRAFTIACAAVGAVLLLVLIWLGLRLLPRRAAPTVGDPVAAQPPSPAPAVMSWAVAPAGDASPSSTPAVDVTPASERFCSACGTANPSQATFCRSCGAGLQGGPR